MKHIIIIVIFLFVPVMAFGAGCGCGTINAIVSNHVSSATSTINANTNAQAQMLSTQILEASRNIIGTIQVQTKSLISAIQLLKESQHQVIKSTAMANEAVEIEKMFGASSQPELLCGASSLGAGLQISTQASNLVSKSLREKQIYYSNNPNSKSVDFINRIISPEHPSIEEMVSSLVPNTTLTSDEVSQANETIKTLGNPFPLPLATSQQLKTPAGEGYATARTIEEGRIALAMEALNQNIAYYSPTLPADITAWAENQWQQAGGNRAAPGISNGKMSQAGLFDLLSQLRIGNPNWIAKIGIMTNMGVAREQLFLDAMNFEIQRRNNELLNRLVVINSLQFLHDIENNSKAEKVYQDLIANQQ